MEHAKFTWPLPLLLQYLEHCFFFFGGRDGWECSFFYTINVMHSPETKFRNYRQEKRGK